MPLITFFCPSINLLLIFVSPSPSSSPPLHLSSTIFSELMECVQPWYMVTALEADTYRVKSQNSHKMNLDPRTCKPFASPDNFPPVSHSTSWQVHSDEKCSVFCPSHLLYTSFPPPLLFVSLFPPFSLSSSFPDIGHHSQARYDPQCLTEES